MYSNKIFFILLSCFFSIYLNAEIIWKKNPYKIDIPEVNKNNPLKYDLPIKDLDRGEAIVLDFCLNTNYMKKGVINIGLGKNKLSIEQNASDMCIKSDGKSYLIEFVPYYKNRYDNDVLNKKTVNLSLIIERISGDKGRWGLISSSEVYWMNMPIKGIISSINISTNKPIADNIKFSGISKGFIDESLYYNSIKVKQLPREAETPKLYLKVDTYNIPGVTHLFIKGLEGKVLEEEMEGLVAYFLKRPLLTTNYNNTLFNEWTKVYMMKWTFDKTNDIRILNRMIEQADTLLRYRDDNYGKYKTLIKNEYTEFTKGWSHFRGLCYVDNEPTKKALGIADIGTGINFHAGVALTIASHPEIWNNSFEGKTYKEIALEMLEDVHENWNYIIKYYYDKKTNLLYSPKYASEPEGVVPQWNRLFPLMASGNILVDASELLNIKDDRINKIDSILKALFKHFWDNARIEKYEGKDVVYYPYGVYRLKSNPEHTEDINHMGFDSRAIRVFHHSGRYWNEEQTKLLSNLMCYRMIKDDKGSFASRQNSEKIIKNYDYSGSLPDLMWFAEFEPQLKDKLLKYSVDVMENRNTMDGRVVFNILHYRALKYGIE